MASRAMVLVLAGSIIGGSIALLWLTPAHAQTLSAQTRLDYTEKDIHTLQVENARLLIDNRESLHRIEDLEKKQALMWGVGLGLGALVSIMQAVQVFVGREIRKIRE